MAKQAPFRFMDVVVQPGEQRFLEQPVSRLFGNAEVKMPIIVIHGKSSGPRLLLTSSIHGDELNGIEIARRVLHSRWISRLKGTLICLPIVNVLGVVHRSRYLPDRRDLNRSFPGSEKGSLAARMAHFITTRILPNVDFAIDLHTGAIHRSNLPQIRVHLENEKAADIAKAFRAPVIVNAEIRDGSLRGVGDDLGVAIITYEAGEALRFEEGAILPGVSGVRNVMEFLGMLPARKPQKKQLMDSVIARSSLWIRAPSDGFFRPAAGLGERVAKGQTIGFVSGPMDAVGEPVIAGAEGIIIGRNNLPLVLEGEAMFNIARFEQVELAEQVVDNFHADLEEHIAGNDDVIVP